MTGLDRLDVLSQPSVHLEFREYKPPVIGPVYRNHTPPETFAISLLPARPRVSRWSKSIDLSPEKMASGRAKAAAKSKIKRS